MKHKNVLTLLMAIVMLLSLMTGCGGTTVSSEGAVSALLSTEDPAQEAAVPETPATGNVVAADSSIEGNDGATVAVTVSDPFEAMAKEYISYPLEGDNSISIWYYIPPYQDFMDSNNSFNALAAAEEATGVHLNFTEVGATSASEQFNMMVASGDYCDLLPVMEYYGAGGTSGLAKAYEEEVIQDITPYIEEYMPNYAAVLEALPQSTVKDTKVEDAVLAFHQIKDGTYSGNGLVTRGDWIDEQGIAFSGDLIGLDEFTDYCRTIHDAYSVPNTIYMYDGTVGLEAAFDTEIPALVSDGFMTMITSAVFRYDDEVASGWITDGYREYLEWVLQMMDEGIIYRDYLSLETDRQVTNSLQANGTIGVWQSNADKISEIADNFDHNGDDNFAVAAMPRVTKDPSEQYVWNDEVALVATSAGFSLSSTCEHPELVCQWENYFWTTDGYYLANYGTEGESYHMDGDTPVFDWDKPLTVTGRNAPNAEMAQQLFTMLRFASFYVDNDMLLATFPQAGLDAVALWTVDGSTDARNYPTAAKGSFTTNESLEIAEFESDMQTYAQETCMKFLDGSMALNDANWDTYVQTVKDMGMDRLLEIYQTAYDEYRAGER